MPEAQADVQAGLMAEAFGFHAENLLTRDYFQEVIDARFAEQDARMETRFAGQDVKMVARIVEQDAKFEARIAAQDARIEKRFSEQDSRFVARFERLELRVGKLESHAVLHTWMLGLISLVPVVPQLQRWFAGPV